MEKSAIQQLSAGYGKLPEQRLLTIQFKGQAETNEAMFYELEICTVPTFMKFHENGRTRPEIPLLCWSLWKRFSEFKQLHTQLEREIIGMPSFQTGVRSVLQGALNKKGRIEFLEKYMNELVAPLLLSRLMGQECFLEFVQIKDEKRVMIANILDWVFNLTPTAQSSTPLLPSMKLSLISQSSLLDRPDTAEESKEVAPRDYLKDEPTCNNDERVNYFLKLLSEVNQTKDNNLANYLFGQFEVVKVMYTEDQAKRLFFGNGVQLQGLLEAAQAPHFLPDIIKLIANCVCEQKNFNNFEKFKNSLAKATPKLLGKMQLGRLLESKTSAKQQLVAVLAVYLEARMRPERQQNQDISDIFESNPEHISQFNELLDQTNSRFHRSNSQNFKLKGSGSTSNLLNKSMENRQQKVQTPTGSALQIKRQNSKLFSSDIRNTPNKQGEKSPSKFQRQMFDLESSESEQSSDFESPQAQTVPVKSSSPMDRDEEPFIKLHRAKPNRRSSGQSLQAQFNGSAQESSDSDRLGTLKSRSSNNESLLEPEMTLEELELAGLKLLEEIKLLISICNNSDRIVEKESSEMFLNPAAFQPDVLYKINMKELVDPFSQKLDSPDGSVPTFATQNVALFRENLETMLLQGESSEDMKKMGMEIKLIREYNSQLRLIEINQRAGPLKNKRITRRYYLAYLQESYTANVALVQTKDIERGNVNDSGIFICQQNLNLGWEPPKPKQKGLETVIEKPMAEEQSLSYSAHHDFLYLSNHTSGMHAPGATEFQDFPELTGDLSPKYEPADSFTAALSPSNKIGLAISTAREELAAKTSKDFKSFGNMSGGDSPALVDIENWHGLATGPMSLILKVKKSNKKTRRTISTLCRLCKEI